MPIFSILIISALRSSSMDLLSEYRLTAHSTDSETTATPTRNIKRVESFIESFKLNRQVAKHDCLRPQRKKLHQRCRSLPGSTDGTGRWRCRRCHFHPCRNDHRN